MLNPKFYKEPRSATINFRIERSLRDAIIEKSMDSGMTRAAYMRKLVIDDVTSGKKGLVLGPWKSENRTTNINLKMEPTLRKAAAERADELEIGMTDYIRFLAINDLKPSKSTPRKRKTRK